MVGTKESPFQAIGECVCPGHRCTFLKYNLGSVEDLADDLQVLFDQQAPSSVNAHDETELFDERTGKYSSNLIFRAVWDTDYSLPERCVEERMQAPLMPIIPVETSSDRLGISKIPVFLVPGASNIQ